MKLGRFVFFGQVDGSFSMEVPRNVRGLVAETCHVTPIIQEGRLRLLGYYVEICGRSTFHIHFMWHTVGG